MHLTGVAPVHNRAQSQGGSGRATVRHPTTHSDRASAAALAARQVPSEKEGQLWPQHPYLSVQRSPRQSNPFTAPPPQRLWRFALTGLGPLGLLCIFALLAAVFDHVG